MRGFAGKTWEEELKERFMSEGERRGEARGLQSALRTQLQHRFGTLPEELLQRIEAADTEHLKAALASVLTMKSFDELIL